MKKYTWLFVIVAVIAFVLLYKFGPFSSVKGNISYKEIHYEYKPEIGGSVWLYKYSKDSDFRIVSTDIDGNFVIDNLAAGDYLMITISMNKIGKSHDKYKELLNSSNALNTIFGFDITSFMSKEKREFFVADSIVSYYYEKIVEVSDNDNKNKFYDFVEKQQEAEKKQLEIAESILEEIPNNFPEYLGSSGGTAIDIRTVSVGFMGTANEVVHL